MTREPLDSQAWSCYRKVKSEDSKTSEESLTAKRTVPSVRLLLPST